MFSADHYLSNRRVDDDPLHRRWLPGGLSACDHHSKQPRHADPPRCPAPDKLVRTFAWIVLLGRNGAVNKLLMAAGITDAPLALIYNFTGVMIGMTPRPDAARHPHHDLGDAGDPEQSGAGGGDPRRPRWSGVLAHLLPLLSARRRGGSLLVFITAVGFFITPALLAALARR
jgi:hypothetical protein